MLTLEVPGNLSSASYLTNCWRRLYVNFLIQIFLS